MATSAAQIASSAASRSKFLWLASNLHSPIFLTPVGMPLSSTPHSFSIAFSLGAHLTNELLQLFAKLKLKTLNYPEILQSSNASPAEVPRDGQSRLSFSATIFSMSIDII